MSVCEFLFRFLHIYGFFMICNVYVNNERFPIEKPSYDLLIWSKSAKYVVMVAQFVVRDVCVWMLTWKSSFAYRLVDEMHRRKIFCLLLSSSLLSLKSHLSKHIMTTTFSSPSTPWTIVALHHHYDIILCTIHTIHYHHTITIIN